MCTKYMLFTKTYNDGIRGGGLKNTRGGHKSEEKLIGAELFVMVLRGGGWV